MASELFVLTTGPWKMLKNSVSAKKCFTNFFKTFFFLKFFINFQSTIAELYRARNRYYGIAIAIDGPPETVMTIDELQ